MKVSIKSKIVPYRGNSWYFENKDERVYYEKENPTEEELAEAVADANRQYEGLGWGKCFVEPPKVVKEGV